MAATDIFQRRSKALSQAVILYASVHHQNTLKLVRAVAERIHADTVDLLKDARPDLTGYSCVFLASGIYFNTLHRSLLDFIGRTVFDGKKVCILYTCGLRYRDYAKPAARLLARQGARYAGSFGCRGFDTYGVLKRLGGIAKGHPNQADLDHAAAFAAAVVSHSIS